MGKILTLEEVKNNIEVQTYLKHADYVFAILWYKKHGFRHAIYSANIA
jgi:metal-dependent HD superfamily phosphatase/phosphodiesterase